MGIATDERRTRSVSPKRNGDRPPLRSRLRPKREESLPTRLHRLVPAGLAVLALALRLHRLGAESLWIDEGYSISNTNHFDPTAWAQNVRPIYYLFLWIWMRLGHGEFFLRLPSAIFGAGAVVMVYLLGKRLVGERAGILASLLMAISPLQVNHSQEIRMYSLAVLLALAAMYEFVLLMEGRAGRHLILYLAFSALGIATFPLSALILIPQALTAFLVGRRHGLGRWVLAEVALAVICVPILVNGIRYMSDLTPETSTGVSAPDVLRIVGEFALLARGPAGSLTGYAFWGYTLVTLALAGFGLRRMRNAESEMGHGLLLALWLVVPIALTAEIVRITGAMWLPRYVLYASPAFFLLIGSGVTRLPSRRLRYLLSAAVLVFPMIRLARYYERPTHPQWREAVQLIQEKERPGDVIALYRPGNGVVFGFYYRGRSPWMEIGQPKLQRRRPWTEARAAETIGDLHLSHRRVWLVMSEESPDAGRAIERHIRATASVLLARSYTRVEVLLYARGSPSDAQKKAARSADGIPPGGASYRRRVLHLLVGPPGFEPGTNRL